MSTTPAAIAVRPAAPHPDFLGMVRGELLKISRQRPILVMGIIIGVFLPIYVFRYALFLAISNSNGGGTFTSDAAAYVVTMGALSDVRGLTGIFITIAAVIVIALEYQQGTIRVLLSRGVGRMQLLGAKLVAIGILGFLAYLAALLLMAIGVFASFGVTGTTADFSLIPDYFWPDIMTMSLTVLVSVLVTGLLAATLAVVGRSMAFGLGLGLPFFVAFDYVLTLILAGIGAATQNTFWTNVPTFFLGINLITLPGALIPNRGVISDATKGLTESVATLVSVDATHAIVTILVWVAALLALSFWLTRQRDVLQ